MRYINLDNKLLSIYADQHVLDFFERFLIIKSLNLHDFLIEDNDINTLCIIKEDSNITYQYSIDNSLYLKNYCGALCIIVINTLLSIDQLKIILKNISSKYITCLGKNNGKLTAIFKL